MRMTRLDECCEIVSGATPKTGVADYWDGDIRWVTPADLSKIDGAYIDETPRRVTQAGLQSCAATLLPSNSVLLSSRAPIGYAAINTRPMATNQGLKSLVPKPDQAEAKYLYHWARAHTGYLQGLGNGATFKELSKSAVARIEIPLPSLAEQRRTASVLDQADALLAKRRQTLAHLDDLTHSIFLDTFGDPRGWPSRFPMATVGELADSVQYGTSAKAGAEGDWPILRMGNITYDGRLDLTDLKYIDLADADITKYTLRRGDLLFNRTNSPDKVGKTAVVDTDERLAFAGYLVRVRMRPENSSAFLSGYLNSAHGKAVLRGMAKAIVNQANINASEMRSIKIAWPPSELQFEFEQRVAVVTRQREMMLGPERVDVQLIRALQTRAFSGRL